MKYILKFINITTVLIFLLFHNSGLIEKETTVTQTRTLESAPPRRTSQGITVTDDTPTQTDRTNSGGCCG